MYNIKISSGLLLCFLSMLSVSEGQPLTINVQTDKNVYEFAQPICTTLSIQNNNSTKYILSEVPFERPSELLFRIESPNSTFLHSEREYGKHYINNRPNTFEVDPGERIEITINLLDHYPEMHLRGNLQNFDEAGTYELTANYYLEYAKHQVDIYKGIFTGPMQSEPVRFVVKPLNGKRLEEILELLNEDDTVSKVKGLSLLRRGHAISHINDFMQYLEKRQPRELRIETAYAMYDSPDPNSWEMYVNYLDDNDSMIRSYMAEILGKIGNPNAGDALFAVTDPNKYPLSYAAAFKALIDLDDRRVLDVAENLSRKSPSAVIRKMAKDIIDRN